MNSAKDGIPHFEVPPELRAMTEKSMEQAKAAFNTFMISTQQALSHFEGQAKAMQASAKDVSEKAMTWFNLEQEPSIWISAIASALLLILIMRKG